MVTSFQKQIDEWVITCFGADAQKDKLERADRLLEEVLELLQSVDYPRERIRALEDYTFNRPKGDPFLEAGGVQTTLAAFCTAHDIDMKSAASQELFRIWNKIESIAAKQKTKPTGSALPIPQD